MASTPCLTVHFILQEPQLAVGTKIEARLKGKSRWFPGSIIATHDNETYDIEYEDGEKEKNVAKNLIRIPRRYIQTYIIQTYIYSICIARLFNLLVLLLLV
jgi:hypothetical protein